MAIYSTNPSELPKGAFWYVVPGKEPMICEKRDGEGQDEMLRLAGVPSQDARNLQSATN